MSMCVGGVGGAGLDVHQLQPILTSCAVMVQFGQGRCLIWSQATDVVWCGVVWCDVM